MTFAIHTPPSWRLPESAATPEDVFLNRRSFLRVGTALAAGAALLPSIGCAAEDPLDGVPKYPREVKRNDRYRPERPLTRDVDAASYNNFYEFTTDKTRVWKLARRLETKPWSLEIAGHAKKTGTFDAYELLEKLPQEERVYRFRCVETWAMAVPWIGVPMAKFLEWAEPTDKAKYVRFVTVDRPEQMVYEGAGWARSSFPYYEGLRIDEARNELTLLATGLFGRALPKQNGAPIRLIVPWKYGFKSAKSLARIEFVAAQPKTFWNDLAPTEYGFFANVNPEVPHPRWSQAQEHMIPDGEKRPTLKFNGYGEQVAALYQGMDLKRNF